MIKKHKLNILYCIVSIILFSFIVSCTKENKIFNSVPNDKDIIILFTNDVHCAYDDNIGYAGLMEYKKRIMSEDNYLILVDNGDFTQGSLIGNLSRGKCSIDIMKYLGYEFCTLGNSEFVIDKESTFSNFSNLDGIIHSSNFIDLRNNEPVLKQYKIFNYGNKKIAFVAASTPDSYESKMPVEFLDSNGNRIYSFCESKDGELFYQNIQKSVDSARKEGADYVILVGHLGLTGLPDKWKSTTLISKTNGIDFMIDGHSHEKYIIKAKNKDGKEILIVQADRDLTNIGKVTITKNGMINAELIDSVPPLDGSPIIDENGKKINVKDKDTILFISNITDKYRKMVEKIAYKDNKSNLTIYYPNSTDKAITKSETNLGDLVTDAYKIAMGADISLINGGGIMNNLPIGDITYYDCFKTLPYNYMTMLIKCKGQIIKDALEFGASKFPQNSDGFLQVSGLTYTINCSIPTSVKLTHDNKFISVDGKYRVSDIKIDGKDLDVNKEYLVAGHDYMLKHLGEGFTMFKGCEILKNGTLLDIDVLCDHMNAVGTDKYKNEAGNGRIKIINQ